MKVSELLTMLPRRAQKMSSEDAIYYLNYPVKEDIQSMMQALYPSYYEKSVIYNIQFPSMSIISVSDNGNGGSTCTVASNTLDDGDMVVITNSTDYDGIRQISNSTVTSFDIDVPFVSTRTGIATSDFKGALPEDCVYPLEVQPKKYPRVKIETRDKYDKQPYSVSVDDDNLVVPVGAPYKSIQMWYMRDVPIVNTVSEDVPYPSKAQRQIVPVLLYGMCLEFFRDRKKANDIKIYLDKYNQAKANIARLSVKSLI